MLRQIIFALQNINMYLKMKHTLLAVLLFLVAFTYAGNEYVITVDLKNITKDKVKVVCQVPTVKESEVVFVFPNVIPGSYALKEYGRYIEGFKAYDANGKALKTKKADKYNYTIYGANTMVRIDYNVNDSWEEKDGKRFIFQPGGTNIEENKSFVVNHYGFFGYLEGYKNLHYKLTFTKPDAIVGYSYLKKKEIGSDKEEYNADGYDFLADNPILFCRPNYSFFTVNNCKAHVCVYSASGKIQAADIAEKLTKVGGALEKFFGTLPVDEYYFLFYFDDPNNIPQRKGKGLGSGTGALEHNHSSFYYLMEMDLGGRMTSMINEVCSHEFLHILTPLNLHSKEIADFNFRTPVMSKHLWMYEGVTEYFSNLALLQDSVITLKDYWSEMQSKMRQSAEFDEFSFTDMSKNVITEENQARYLAVYNRGALLAMGLDWTIIESTNGKKNLKQVMFELAKMYGVDRPFNDDELISKFVELTTPEVQAYFNKYIVGSAPLYYPDMFKKVGYNYKTEHKEKAYTFGQMSFGYDKDKEQFKFVGVEANAFDVQNGDVLLEIAGEKITLANAEEVIVREIYENSTGDALKIKISRNGSEMVVTGKPQTGTRTVKNYIGEMDSPSEKQEATFKYWLNN